jgi:hypothetical protein
MSTLLVNHRSTPLSVYSGQRLLGTVEQVGGKFIARNPAGAIVGIPDVYCGSTLAA